MGVRWLAGGCGGGDREEGEGEGEEEWDVFGRGWLVLVGHSVGATMGLKMVMRGEEREGGGIGSARERVKAIVSLAGIADFVALRDAHLEFRDGYDGFCRAAFGEEAEGGWELGRVFPRRGIELDGREGEDLCKGVMKTDEGVEEAGVEVAVLGQGKADELVEWDQVEILREEFRRRGWEEKKDENDDDDEEEEEEIGKVKKVKRSGGSQSERSLRGGVQSQTKKRRMAVVELEGGHDDVWEQGREIARCVGLAIEMLAGRNRSSGERDIE